MKIDLNLLKGDIQREGEILEKLIVDIWDQIEVIIPKIMGYKRIILVGCGDSYFASIAGKCRIENLIFREDCPCLI